LIGIGIAIEKQKPDRDRRIKIASGQQEGIIIWGKWNPIQGAYPNGVHFDLRLDVFPGRMTTSHQKTAPCFSKSPISASKSLFDYHSSAGNDNI
jgi:hypothetical protein